MEQNTPSGEIQKFFKNDLKAMFVSLFKKPGSCVENFVRESNGTSVTTPLCTIVLSFLVMALCTWFLLLKSGVTEYLEGGKIIGMCLKTGIVPLVFAAFLTILLFVAMALKSCTDFKLAFFNVSLHQLVYSMVTLFLTLIIIIAGKDIGNTFFTILIIAAFIYALTWGIGNVRQALMAISGDEAYSWWLAPLVIGLTFTLTFFVVKSMVDVPMPSLF